jgi:hypothetical protein
MQVGMQTYHGPSIPCHDSEELPEVSSGSIVLCELTCSTLIGKGSFSTSRRNSWNRGLSEGIVMHFQRPEVYCIAVGSIIALQKVRGAGGASEMLDGRQRRR